MGEDFIRFTGGCMPLLIVTTHMSVSIVVPVRLGGIDAAGFMLLMIAPSMWGLIVAPFVMTIPVLTHADFVFNVRDRISGTCDVRPVAIDRGWATTAGIGCGRHR